MAVSVPSLTVLCFAMVSLFEHAKRCSALSNCLLILMRHAKSSWKDERLADHDRPLNKRGERDAPTMGRRLRDAAIRLDSILCSSAVRALSTAERVAEQLESAVPLQVLPELYGAAAADVLNLVAALGSEVKACLVVGHNPTVTELANHFSERPIENVPTSGILLIRTEEWERIALGQLAAFDFPKNPFPPDLQHLTAS